MRVMTVELICVARYLTRCSLGRAEVLSEAYIIGRARARIYWAPGGCATLVSKSYDNLPLAKPKAIVT